MKLLNNILIHTHGINSHQWACSFLYVFMRPWQHVKLILILIKKNYVGMSQTGYEFFGYFWDDGFWSCWDSKCKCKFEDIV